MYLFNGSVELTKILTSNPNIDAMDVILTRLPFVLLVGAIIIVCYKISKIFVMKILEINTQKLRFSEIGIISKDTCHAATDGLDLDDNEKYELRTKLKMDLLRHHLKKLDPEEFECDINPSLWDKYTNLIKGKLSKDRKPKA
ncbi:MAG: hypothetical protein IME94_03720 [Proteobacteria bacterium]|nr:hypothetical protein [Pseudomonadota bacterium]